MVDQLLNWVYQWVVYIYQQIRDFVMGIINQAADYFANLARVFIEWVSEIFHTIATQISNFVGAIQAALKGVLDSIVATLQSIVGKLQELTVKVIDTITQYANSLLASVRVAVQSAIEQVGEAVNRILNELRQGVERIINQATETVRAAKQAIVDMTRRVFDTVERTYRSALARIEQGIEVLLGGAGSLIESISQRLGDLREAFGSAATELSAALAGVGSEYIDPLRTTLDDYFSRLVDFADPRETEKLTDQMRRITSGESSPDEIRRFISTEWARYVPESSLWTWVFSVVGSIVGILMTFLTLGQAQAQVLLQDYVREYPYQILNPADVTTAWRRGYVTENNAIEAIRRQGYDEETARVILRLSEQVPPEQDLFALWHRQLIDEKTVDAALFQKGYSDDYIASLKRASFLIPPVGDLITMAVREAFSPEVAERFGQFEDFPPDFAHWAERQGLSEEWSKRYWAAHWALPSPQQGFEMLQRGVVDVDDLNLLLRALDVMPFWRDKLTQIAYRPFSRVDVRRMHKLGVLDDAQVFRAYQDLGYDVDKAKAMTDFTILYNAPKKADDDIELNQLTRSSIVNFYADGLLSRDQANKMLLDVGYSQEAATLYLDAADLDNERKERKNEVDLILDLAKVGAIDFAEAQDRLHRLELSSEEIQRAIAELERNEARKTKLPSRTEAERMFKAGAISIKDYQELLETLGYHPKWVRAFLQVLEAERAGQAIKS